MAAHQPPTVVGFDKATSREATGQRDRFSYRYRNGDGSWTGKFFTHPVNFRDAKGAWQPIDSSLADSGKGRWTNRADSLDVSFAPKAGPSDLAVMDVGGGRRFGFGVDAAQDTTGEVTGSTVTYKGIRPDADVVLSSLNGGSIKEKIILHSPTAPTDWDFPLRTDGVTPRMAADGSVELVDAAGAVVGRLPHGFMVDSRVDPHSGDGERSEAVSYSLERRGAGWALHVSADKGWLADPARKFPVTVDPTTVWNYGDTSDTYVQTGYSSPPNGDIDLKAGTYDGGANKAATYLGFSQVDNDLKHATIYDVDLHVYNYWSYSCSARAVTVHPVTHSWSSDSIANYPGPSYGSALASRSFAHGYIPPGASSSSCPAKWEGIDLGSSGNKLVQGWVNGTKPDYGLTVRASVSSSTAWKKFASRETPNGPYLTITYSPYNAKYAFAESPPVVNPAVLNDQAGYVHVKVTNKGHTAWTTSNGYKLQYEVFDKNGKQLYHKPAQTPMPQTVSYGETVTLNAKINPLPPGTWYVKFDMINVDSSSYELFSDWGVPRTAVLKLTVPDVPSVLKEMYPHNNYQVGTLTPQLFAEAKNGDAWPSSKVTYWFTICGGAFGDWDWCESSPWQQTPKWTVPTGKLQWGQDYYWTVWVSDSGGTQTPGPWYRLSTAVEQPAITSHLASGASADQEFDPQAGNYTTTATDAQIATAGPPVSVVRTYNSLDPRSGEAFGAGWSSRYDMSVMADADGSGNVVVTYPDGQQVRFGKNSDGTFTPPQGRQASFAALDGGGWKLMDKSATTYAFDATGRLTSVTDHRGRAETLAYDTGGKLATVTAAGGRHLHFTWSGSHVATVSTDPVDGSALTWTYAYSGDELTSVCPPGTTTECTTYGYGTGSHYATAVQDSGPAGYWRLGDASGSTATNALGYVLGTANGTYTSATLGAAGAPAGTSDTAAHFAGSGYVRLPDRTISRESAYLAVEAWFKTTGHGVIFAYQDAALPNASGKHTPAIYVGTDGKLRGQFWRGSGDSAQPITTPSAVNNGAWHHVVLSGAGSSQTLFVDGQKIGSLSGTIDHLNQPIAYVGSGWVTSGWPSTLSSGGAFGFTGDIDDVAVYDKPLGQPAVTEHYAARVEAQQLTGVTTPAGRTHASNTYDSVTDRLTRQVDEHGGTWQISTPAYAGTVDDVTKTVTVTDPRSSTLSYAYEPLRGNRLIGETDELGNTTNYGYDDAGGLASVTDRNGNVTAMWRDARGNLIGQTRCADEETCHTRYYHYYLNPDDAFDPRNDQLDASSDGRSNDFTDPTYVTTYYYDDYGEQTAEIWPKTDQNPDDLRGITYTYTDGTEAATDGGTMPPGLLRTTTAPGGRVTRYAYTAAGDLAQEIDPVGKVTSYTYDALGRRLSTTETSDSVPSGATTTYAYDGQNRLTTETDPAARNETTGITHTPTTTYTYDADGNQLTGTLSDTSGGDEPRTTTSTYDDHGQLASLTNPEGGAETYDYDATGARTGLTDTRGAHYLFGYTARGQLASRTLTGWTGNPDDPSAARDVVLDAYAYDPGGRLAAHTDAMGRTNLYAYYGDDQLATITALDAKLNGDSTGANVVVESREYDGAGNITARVTGGGSVRTEYNYDQAGYLIGTELDPDGLGRRVDYGLDANNEITTVTRTGADGDRTEISDYTYDPAGRVVSQAVHNGDTQSLTTTYTRDQRGLVTATVDPRGNTDGGDPAAYTTTRRYDTAGQLVESDQPSVGIEHATSSTLGQPVTRYGYDTAGEQTQTTDPEGRTTTTAYDRDGRTVSVQDPSYTPPGSSTLTPTSTFTYDDAGQVTDSTDPRGNTTSYAYDILGNPVHTDDPQASGESGHGRWSYDYDLDGEALAVTDPTGARTEATYDDLGRQITATAVERYPAAAAYTTTMAYDAAGNRTSVTRPAGDETRDDVNAAGEITAQTDPLGNVTHADYDLAGRLTKVTDPLGNATTAEFDLAGRMTGVTDYDADGTTLRNAQIGYDAAGNVTSKTSAEGHTTTYAYDAANRQTSQTEPVTDTTSITTGFGYDAVGERTRLTDGRGNATTTSYNSLGKPEQVIEPATAAYTNAADRTWTTEYDAAGNPVHEAQPGGVTIDRSYDELGRLTAETGSGAEATTTDKTYGYDLAGRRTHYSAPDGDTTYTYNDRGLPLTMTAAKDNTASYGYDDDGRLTSRTDATGPATFAYNGNDQLTSSTDAVSGVGVTYEYDNAGRPTHTNLGYGGARRDYTYDAENRLTGDQLISSSGASLATTAYEYDRDDNLTAKTTTGTAGAGRNTYGYDDAGRLTNWTDPAGATAAYTWDDSGNRTQAGTKTFTYDAQNRLTNSTDAGTTTTYAYTPRGTQTTRTTGGTTTSSAYDAFDHLITDGAVTNGYDALDRVTTRASAGTTQRFAYSTDDNDPAAITDDAGTVQSAYARDPAGNLIALSEGGWSMWAITNNHDDDSTVAWTNGTTLLGSTDYSPFGVPDARSGAQPTIGYQGEYTDPDTGRVDMHARWYTPGTATFTSRDTTTVDPDPSIQANRYTYANANPLTNTDPTGHWAIPPVVGVGLGTGTSLGIGAAAAAALGLGALAGYWWRSNWYRGSSSWTRYHSWTAPTNCWGLQMFCHNWSADPRFRSSGSRYGGYPYYGGAPGGWGSPARARPPMPSLAQIQGALARAAALKPAPRPVAKPGITQKQLNKIRDNVEKHVTPITGDQNLDPILNNPANTFQPQDADPRPSPLAVSSGKGGGDPPSVPDTGQPPTQAHLDDAQCSGHYQRYDGQDTYTTAYQCSTSEESPVLLGRLADMKQYIANKPEGSFDADFLNIRGTMANGKKGVGGWNWTRNKQFIDNAISSGREVRLVTNPDAPIYSGGNVYQRELKYLTSNGFGWERVDDHWRLVRTRPSSWRF
ncbi:MAG TPA: LamG-like jellyroll fold domain-containing protein [Streptosporangiaceae bacterium]|jgi:RHS repeat-associated protein